MKIILSFLVVFLLSGCIKKYGDDGECEYETISFKELRANYPKVTKAREIKNAGKIYSYQNGDILLINEKNIGIHIVDNKDRMHPKRKSFIQLPGNIDIAVKDGFIYADSFTDLVVIDIRDINDIKFTKRKEDMFNYNQTQAIWDLDMDQNCYYYEDRADFIIGRKN